ncbi:MAG: cyclic pyranopterin monophosphate synthase MoaC [Deltaproteobacteria bacterium]|nr:cyclic pyranopterin monophosphate synthase MoaC [Deltaproteobacteria bacterium]
MKMIDVGGKEKTRRVAIARGFVSMEKETLERIRENRVEKGDVLAAARLAGIMAAKRTPDIIPLCHPIGLTAAEVSLTLQEDPPRVLIESRVETTERTGVEMEALHAVCAAALTVYDMLKAVDKGMTVSEVALHHKSGGRSGVWTRR